MRALVLLLGLGAGSLRAATSLAPLEAEPASARSAALGGAVTGLGSGDGWELNPAGLADAPALGLSLNEDALPGDIQRQALQGFWGGGPQGSLGYKVTYTNFGPIQARDGNGAATGTLQPWRAGAGLAWGWAAGYGFNLGTSLIGFQQDLDGGGGSSGLIAGAGASWNWLQGQVLSLDLQTAGGSGLERVVAGAGGPLGWGLGYFLQAMGEQNAQQWNTSLGLEKQAGILALRLGWRSDAGEGNDVGSGLSAGLGIAYMGWSLDYAFMDLGGLGSQQRVTLGWQPYAESMAVPESATATAQPPLVPESAQAPPLPPLEGLSATAEAETTTAAAVAPTPAPTPALTLEFRLPDTAVDEALTAEDDGKFKQAVAAYQDALKTDPADTRAWMGLGRLYWRQGQKDYALQCYEQVLRLNPGDTELKAWLDKARQHQAGTP